VSWQTISEVINIKRVECMVYSIKAPFHEWFAAAFDGFCPWEHHRWVYCRPPSCLSVCLSVCLSLCT